MAGGVDREPSGEIVRAIQHQVAAGQEFGGVFWRQCARDRIDRDMRIERCQGVRRRRRLRNANIVKRVEDLALQVR
jgi:hypothetical protein